MVIFCTVVFIVEALGLLMLIINQRKFEKGETVTIPYEEREFIFSTPKDADKKLKELKRRK